MRVPEGKINILGSEYQKGSANLKFEIK